MKTGLEMTTMKLKKEKKTMIEKIDAAKEKLVEVISKKLDNDTITSKELFDYAQILSNLKSSEEYKDMLSKAMLAAYPNGFNGGGGLIS